MKPSDYPAYADKMADEIMKQYKEPYKGRRKEGRAMLVRYILYEMNQYAELEEDADELVMIDEGACEMLLESWENRY